ncbi:MAG: hypothetical protein SFU86_20235 [Pirellulaceae bacterium]|nr:hypothetical protein [Pirellulaceae bacterium]
MPLTLAGLCGLALLASPREPAIEFAGETYRPAYRAENADLKLVEFVRDGETIETWTKLFAVRHFPKLADPATAVANVRRALAEQNPLAKSQLLVKEDGSEAMIDFLTWGEGAPGMEFNVFLYLRQPGLPGLVCYQFAARINDSRTVSADELRARKDAWCRQLREMDLPVVLGRK